MTAQVKQPEVQGSSGNVASNNSLMHITVGPTALASKAIYEMLTAYLLIMKEQAAQKNNFYKCQLKEVTNQAKQTVKAAYMQMWGLVGAGAMMILGGIGAGLANNYKSKSEYAENENNMNNIKAESTPLKEIDKVQPQAAETSMGPDDASDNIQQRIQELKNGDFIDDQNNYDQPTTDQAIQHMKATDPEGFKNMKSRLNEQITQRAQDMNSYAQKLQGITVTRQTWSGMVSSFSQAGGNAIQGGCKIGEAEAQKDVELYRTAAGQASQGASELGQDLAKQYNNAMQALQALGAIRQSSETSNM